MARKGFLLKELKNSFRNGNIKKKKTDEEPPGQKIFLWWLYFGIGKIFYSILCVKKRFKWKVPNEREMNGLKVFFFFLGRRQLFSHTFLFLMFPRRKWLRCVTHFVSYLRNKILFIYPRLKDVKAFLHLGGKGKVWWMRRKAN